jgi:hypothetical protein
MNALEVWTQSNGEVTRKFYAELWELGPLGDIAVALFRANKCSARAKMYRGRGYKSAAYDRKEWSIGKLVEELIAHAEPLGIVWGWREDPQQPFHKWVIYVELPNDIGQVSFHLATRGQGPDYLKDWDGQQASTERICKFCDQVFVAPLGI